MAKRRGLGRGLSSLIPPTDSPTTNEDGLRWVPIDAISPNPLQPRTKLDENKLAELADSVREHGLIQPLVLRETGPGEYSLIAGERRWRAASIAGLNQVPAVIKEASPQAMLELALIENIQRDDLNALEEALAYQQLIEEFGLTQAEVASHVGKSRSTVANMIRLLNLPESIRAMVAEGQISGAHARALLPLANPEAQNLVAASIVKNDLSVRQVEMVVSASKLDVAEEVKNSVYEAHLTLDHAMALLPLNSTAAQIDIMNMVIQRKLSLAQTEGLVAKRLSSKKPEPRPRYALPPELLDLESQFRLSLGTKVNIQQGDKGGQVVIHYYSKEELQAIYEAIVGED
jgi:ParB family chromosome partitioning protein